jgi:hypothetical protein
VKAFPERINWWGKICLEYGQHHPIGWSADAIKVERE